MKRHIIWICIVALVSVAGCGQKKPKPKHEHTTVKEAAAKPDYYKAALLNVEMGQLYLAQGQTNRAKQKLVHALELQPKMPEAHSAIGYFYETVGDLDTAEKHYNQAINFGSGKGRYYNNYGTFLCRQKRFKEADRAFNNALRDKQYIKTAEVFENAGLCALQQPDLDKAYAYLKTAVKHDPKRALASLELAAIELNHNNPKTAEYYLRMFKQNSQPTSRSLWIAVQTYEKLNKQDDVASALLQLKSMFPESDEYKGFLESQK